MRLQLQILAFEKLCLQCHQGKNVKKENIVFTLRGMHRETNQLEKMQLYRGTYILKFCKGNNNNKIIMVDIRCMHKFLMFYNFSLS